MQNLKTSSSTISVLCTRPLLPGESSPHVNQIEEEQLLDNSRDHKCCICGMDLILQYHFVPVELLDRGGFGRTFIIRDLGTPGSKINDKKKRVLKQLDPVQDLKEPMLQKVIGLFQREANTLCDLKHSKIPTFYNYFNLKSSSDSRLESLKPQQLLYLVEQYIPGQNLSKKYENSTQNFGESEIEHILSQLLPVLKYIHQEDIIHRDIKPPNIICDSNERLHLIDFGAVKDKVKTLEEGLTENSLPTESSTKIATLGLSPPEQVLGCTIYPSSDIYSLAATCISLLIRKSGFELEESIRSKKWNQDANISSSLTEILEKMLSYSHSDRYQTAEEVIQALESKSQPPESGSKLPKIIKRTLIPVTLITLALISGLVIKQLIPSKEPIPPTSTYPTTPDNIDSDNIKQRMSLGEKRLTTTTTSAKEKAIKAFNDKDYGTAISEFENSRKQKLNDPETLVYLNNAKAFSRDPIKIAISIPIGKSEPIALEMLRGLAQIQNKVHENGGINGRYLQVVIMNDDNDPEIGKKIAQEVVKDPSIIAVIGSNTAEVSRVTSQIYQEKKVVMVNPTSGSPVAGIDKTYIFQILPTPELMPEYLARDISQTNNNKIAICYDTTAQDSMSFKTVFSEKLSNLGGIFFDESNGFDCQFDSPNFDVDSLMEKAKKLGADGLLLSPSINNLEPVIELAKANKGELALFGSPSLYTLKTITLGQESVDGLTFYAPWHPDIDPDNKYLEEAKELWGGSISWRTVTTIEAALVVTEGLKEASKPTSIELQKAIADPNFVLDGMIPYPIKFLKGHREGEPVKVKIEPGGPYDYTFVLQNKIKDQ